jgi:opacity protein-like surface antigen/outer membrane protease
MIPKHIFRLAMAAASTIAAGFYPYAAGAADLAVPAATGVNWDGVYAGIQGAVAAGSATWSGPTGYFSSERGEGVPPDVRGKGPQGGLLGGLQIGYNRQFGAFVLGLEGDASFGPLDGYAVCGGTVGPKAPKSDPFQRGSGDPCHVSTNWLASATGRFGYAFGRALVYAKGGMAFAGDQYDVYNPTDFPGNPAHGSADLLGWTLGAGLEYALGGNWSAKAEYDYYDFGTRTIGFSVPGYPGFNSFSLRRYENLAKFGLNYRFADTGGGDVSAPAPAILSDITGEFGGRVGFSSGRYQEYLYSNANAQQLNSRLTWPDQTGVSLESFARADHVSGIFAKGYFGGNDLLGAHQNDEDFPPDHNPYSNTLSPTSGGRDLYASADIGYSFLRASTWRLGGFVGYHYYSQRMNAYGSTQLAPQGGAPVTNYPGNVLILGQTEYWQALRVGLGGDVLLTDRLKLYAEAVWLPYMSFTGKDNHWLRPDINPQYDYGQGYNGFQTEAVLSYALTDRIDIGVGGRYWLFQAQHSSTQFPGAEGRSPESITSSRYGGFLQASYKFGDVAAAPVVAKY